MSPKLTGEFMAKLRKKELTQEKLASKLNVTGKAISRLEMGKGIRI